MKQNTPATRNVTNKKQLIRSVLFFVQKKRI